MGLSLPRFWDVSMFASQPLTRDIAALVRPSSWPAGFGGNGKFNIAIAPLTKRAASAFGRLQIRSRSPALSFQDAPSNLWCVRSRSLNLPGSFCPVTPAWQEVTKPILPLSCRPRTEVREWMIQSRTLRAVPWPPRWAAQPVRLSMVRLHSRCSLNLRRCKTGSVGQSAGMSILRSSVRFQQKLQNPRTQIYMDLSYIDPQAKVLDYCFKS